MVALISLLIILLLMSCSIDVSCLTFNKDGTFKLLQLTDLHFNRDTANNQKTHDLMMYLIQKEKPNVVILSGDVITGDDWDKKDTNWFQNLWKYAVSPMVETKTLYAMILGNHDGHAYLSRDDITEFDRASNAFSLTKGRNYYIDIDYVDGTDHVYRIWLFDSLDNRCVGRMSWGCVEKNAIEQALNTSIPHNGVSFIHIPTQQVKPVNLRNKVGTIEEAVSSSLYTNDFESLVHSHNISAVFHGHDHGNDFVGYNKIGTMIGYGRQTGYGGYRVKGMMLGARIIVLRRDARYPETYVRLSNGTRLDQNEFKDNRNHTATYIPILFVVGIVVVSIWTFINKYKLKNARHNRVDHNDIGLI